MPLKLYLRGEVWHYRGTVAGRRLRGSTGIARENKATAQEWVSREEVRAWQSDFHGPGSVLTFAQAAILYRSSGRPVRFLVQVEDYWRDTPVKEITAGRIKAACVEIYPHATGATRNRAVIVPTQAIINFAAEQELCPKVFVKRWPVPTTNRKAASWTWVAAFQSAASPRLGALACFMFLTGARISEACTLKWSNMDLSGHRAVIRQTKTNSERVTHLPQELILAIANIPGDRRPDATVFGMDRHSAWRQWKRTIERADIEYMSPHSCRHGFATGLLQAGVDPVTVAKLGGWKGVAQLWATYGHAREDRTLTDLLTQKDGGDIHKRLNIKRG